MGKRTNKYTTLEGLVIPAEWDDFNNVIAVKISADDESEYMVENDSLGRELLKHLSERVRVKGLVMRERNYGLSIAVKSFSLLFE